MLCLYHDLLQETTLSNLSNETTEGCIRYIFDNSLNMCNQKSVFQIPPAGSLDSKSVTMIVRKISEKGIQIVKLSRTEKLEKRGAFLEQLLEKF